MALYGFRDKSIAEKLKSSIKIEAEGNNPAPASVALNNAIEQISGVVDPTNMLQGQNLKTYTVILKETLESGKYKKQTDPHTGIDDVPIFQLGKGTGVIFERYKKTQVDSTKKTQALVPKHRQLSPGGETNSRFHEVTVYNPFDEPLPGTYDGSLAVQEGDPHYEAVMDAYGDLLIIGAHIKPVEIIQCGGFSSFYVKDVQLPDGSWIGQHKDEVIKTSEDQEYNAIFYTLRLETCYKVVGRVKGLSKNITLIGQFETLFPNCYSCEGCFLLEDCEATAPDIVTDSRAVSPGTVVLLDTNICYTVTDEEPCGEDPDSVAIIETFEDCESCKVMLLENCYTEEQSHAILRDVAIEIGNVYRYDGVCYELKGTDIDPDPMEEITVYIGEELQELYDECHECNGYKLEPCPGQSGAPSTRYVWGAVIGQGDDQGVNFDLSEHLYDGEGDGWVLAIEDESLTGDLHCYKVTRAQPGETLETNACAVYESFHGCEGDNPYSDCIALEFQRVDEGEGDTCSTPDEPSMITFSDVRGQRDAAPADIPAGTTFIRAEDGFCWEYVGEEVMTNADATWAFTIEEEFEDCENCNNPRYLLEAKCAEEQCGPCGGDGDDPDDIITDEPLSDAIGKYVKVEGQCYKVSVDTSEDPLTHESPLGHKGPFGNCVSCADAEDCLEVLAKINGTWKAVKIIIGNRCQSSDATSPCE